MVRRTSMWKAPRISKNLKIKSPIINIEARIPRLVFTNRNEKRKKEEINTKANKNITG